MGKIIAIAATGEKREIGQEGKLPWPSDKYRDDMRHFTKMTKGTDKVGHSCIMTIPAWLSIPESYRPLDGRPNIIVTSKSREESGLPAGVITATSPAKAVMLAERLTGNDEIYICGGRYLYEWAVDHADELLITEIPEEFPNSDAFFPEFLSKGWIEAERTLSPNGECTFVRYRRKR